MHVLQILAAAKALAQEYRALTGRPLGITGEVAEYEAAQLLGLKLQPAREVGYDAIDREGRKIQIKGRCLRAGSKPGTLGRIDVSKPFDTVLVVLLDESFETISMHEAGRQDVLDALEAPGSKSRNERGTLSVSKFKSIGKTVWQRDQVDA
ncbi:MAG: hypothetical protein F4Y02_00090 [Chloroflexi bacterium]|nr:hypothetical protein [Chloroflexota bacterium]